MRPLDGSDLPSVNFTAIMDDEAKYHVRRAVVTDSDTIAALFIMGDDIGWMQPSCYHRGLMVGAVGGRQSVGVVAQMVLAELAGWPMLNGRVNGCPPKLSGNSPPAVGWNQSDTSGVTNSSRAANTWPIPGRDYFPFETRLRTVSRALRRWAPFLANGYGLYDMAGNVWQWLPGVLGLSLPSGRDAGCELPRHQQRYLKHTTPR